MPDRGIERRRLQELEQDWSKQVAYQQQLEREDVEILEARRHIQERQRSREHDRGRGGWSRERAGCRRVPVRENNLDRTSSVQAVNYLGLTKLRVGRTL